MLPQNSIFLSSVRDADAVIGVGEGVVEEGVGHDGAGVGKSEQRMVGEHRAQAQETSDEKSLEQNHFRSSNLWLKS